MNKLSLFIVDTETTSLDFRGDIIELSLLRLNDGEQMTWYLKAMNETYIEPSALEINHHKMEDITWKTKEGKEKYKLPVTVLPDIENWVSDDGCSSSDRVLVGHNVTFDDTRIQELWRRNDALNTYPFGERTKTIDTKGLTVFLDWASGKQSESYSLQNLVKRFGFLKRVAHLAESDVLACKDLLFKCKDFVSEEKLKKLG